MKTRCVELSNFERDLVLKFASQPKNAPVSPGLRHFIMHRLEGKSVFARNNVHVYQKSTRLAAAGADE